jgi:long-chain acyl-CoA synthetase
MIIYTSGTTGQPKGALLSHRNLLFTAGAIVESCPLSEADELLSFLPLSHIAERLLTVAVPVVHGCTVSFAESPETVLENLREVRPTVLFSVPRVWEKLMAGVELRMGRADPLKRAVYRWALGRDGAFAHAAVLRSLRQKLGLDRARLVISGAAPIAPTVLEFFRGIGVPIREGYGLTESTAGGTLHQGRPWGSARWAGLSPGPR